MQMPDPKRMEDRKITEAATETIRSIRTDGDPELRDVASGSVRSGWCRPPERIHVPKGARHE
ncbi:MAG: hypothetical protein ACOCWU_04570 [Spirochaetota bacterium]